MKPALIARFLGSYVLSMLLPITLELLSVIEFALYCKQRKNMSLGLFFNILGMSLVQGAAVFGLLCYLVSQYANV